MIKIKFNLLNPLKSIRIVMLLSIDYLFKILCNSCVMFLVVFTDVCSPSEDALWIPCSLNSFEIDDILISFGLDFISGNYFANFLENFFWSFDLVKSKTKWPVIVFPVGVVNDLIWYVPLLTFISLKFITWV